MIAPLRHRQAMAAVLLAVAAPLLLAMGLSGRVARDLEPEPLAEDWGGSVIEELGYRYRVTRRDSASSPGAKSSVPHLEIDARPGQRIPDVLVYGDHGRAPEDALPPSANLLGPLAPHHPSEFELEHRLDENPEHYTIYFVSLMRTGLLGQVDIGATLGDL